MNKRNFSLVACGLLLSASSVFAESSIKTAIAAGQASGDITVHTVTTNNDDSSSDAGFTAGTVGLAYETGELNGFSAKVGFRAAHQFAEEEDGDYKGDFTENSIMNEAYIKYANKSFSLTAGRQEIDLEWIGDFNESVVAEVIAIEDTTITALYANRQAVAAEDELSKFEDVVENEGVYVLDVKYEGIEGVELNPYFYSINDVADIYGLKATYSNDSFGILGHYVATNEDDSSADDGSIYQLELSATLGQFEVAAGYISTDSDGAIGSMDTYGDNIDPTEEIGDGVYGTDADTYYGTISTEVSGVELGLLYANADYADDKELEEVSLFVDYAFNDEFSVGFAYTDVDSNGDDEDFDKASLTATYTF